MGELKTDSLRASAGHLDVLRQYGGKRAQQLVALVAAGQMLAPLVRDGAQRIRNRDDFTIAIAGVDDIYPDLHEWVLARLPEIERKALIASSSCDHSESKAHGIASSRGGRREIPRLRLSYDGQREQTVVIDGHKIKVNVSREEIPGGRERLPDNWRQQLETIRFTAPTAAGRDAVVDMINGLLKVKHSEPGPPPLMLASRWGGSWDRRGDLPPRTLDSVILKDGQLEALVDDFRDFLASEKRYEKLCQPWHRGYLFYGEPGTGKTSVARALANHFEMPTYYLPLADLERDSDLISLVGMIPPRSVLLLEDVDAFHAATDREEEAGSTSVAGMLNALDGVWTPHGLVTIMTTNNRDVLDPALLRAGRVDRDEEFTLLDRPQARRMCDWLGLPGYEQFLGRSPAEMLQAARTAGGGPAVSDLRESVSNV